MLDILGHRLRVVCRSRKILSTIGDALANHVVDGEAFLGYKVDTPSRSKGLFVLLGADGSILARSRDESSVVASLVGHLAGLAAPPAVDRMRFRLRVVVGSEHAVLLEPSLLRAQPLVERRLVALNCGAVDLPFADIDIETMQLKPVDVPWTGIAPHGSDDGHQWGTTLSHTPIALLWPASPSASVVSDAEIRHALAALALSGGRAAKLDAAAAVAGALDIIFVDPSDPGSLHRSIELIIPG